MGLISRRKSREAALRALYQCEIGGSSLAEALEDSLAGAQLEPDLDAFARRLATGVSTRIQEIDAKIDPVLNEYALDRVAAIDRNVLRIAVYELWFEPDVPPAVSINEAIDIAKKYSTAESGKFVNGILGRLVQESPKADWTPPMETEQEQPELETPEQVPEEVVEAGSAEMEHLQKIGGWKLRDEDMA